MLSLGMTVTAEQQAILEVRQLHSHVTQVIASVQRSNTSNSIQGVNIVRKSRECSLHQSRRFPSNLCVHSRLKRYCRPSECNC